MERNRWDKLAEDVVVWLLSFDVRYDRWLAQEIRKDLDNIDETVTNPAQNTALKKWINERAGSMA